MGGAGGAWLRARAGGCSAADGAMPGAMGRGMGAVAGVSARVAGVVRLARRVARRVARRAPKNTALWRRRSSSPSGRRAFGGREGRWLR